MACFKQDFWSMTQLSETQGLNPGIPQCRWILTNWTTREANSHWMCPWWGTRRKQASTDQAFWTPVQSFFLDYMLLVSNFNPKFSMGTNPRDQQTSLVFKMFSKLLIKLFKIFHLLNALCIYEIFLKHNFFFFKVDGTLYSEPDL